jgi:hypothetical protein
MAGVGSLTCIATTGLRYIVDSNEGLSAFLELEETRQLEVYDVVSGFEELASTKRSYESKHGTVTPGSCQMRNNPTRPF